MSTDRAVHSLDGAGLSREYAAGVLTAMDVLARVQDRIERLSDRYGLFNSVADWDSIFDAAVESDRRWAAGEPRSPLDGVPFAVKANIALAGLPWHGGIQAFADRVATEDAAAVATMRAAGMIPVGVLNMHEASLGETGDNPAFQRTLNPRDPRRIAGGSSCGSAAAVAAGVIPIALGTDDMGGVRLPSALCGVVGYKPDHGVIPVDGLLSLSPSLDHIGVHARSVADVRSVLRLFDRNAISRRMPERIQQWMLSDAIHIDSHVANALAVATHSVEPRSPLDWRDVDFGAIRRAALLRCERDGEAQLASALAAQPQGFSEALRGLLAWGSQRSEAELARADALLLQISSRLRTELQGAVALSPTTPVVAPRWGEPVPLDLADIIAPAAIAGLPSITIPASSDGLPVGVQITGGNYLEVLTLAETLFPGVVDVLSESFEEVQPGAAE
ncbi:MAG: amidase [Pseudomonadaceae bacterium]|nr:amidase [Pseudomonadaceae bacterium]